MSDNYISKYSSTPPPENYERYFIPAIGKPLAEDLVHAAGLTHGEKILDVACGTGIVARLAAKEVLPGGSVTGVDPNPGMLAVARAVTPKDMDIEWYEAPAEAMPLPDNTFDVVFCQMGLQFMQDKIRALKEMYRVLAPGGRLILNVPGPIEEPFAVLAEVMKQTISTQAGGFVEQVFSLYEPDEIQELLNTSGFATATIQSNVKLLELPAPEHFLWQYIYSTPLAEVMSKVNPDSRKILGERVLERWQNLSRNGSMKLPQQMVTATAQKDEF